MLTISTDLSIRPNDQPKRVRRLDLVLRLQAQGPVCHVKGGEGRVISFRATDGQRERTELLW